MLNSLSRVSCLSTSILPVDEPINTFTLANALLSWQRSRYSLILSALTLSAPIWKPQFAWQRPSARLHFFSSSCRLTVAGTVLGMSMNDVTPPSRAALDSVAMSAFCVIPGSRKCTCASMAPAIRNFPLKSRVTSALTLL